MTKSSEGLKSAADVAKQIIALSTGVIALTVSFFDKLQGDTPNPWVRGLILLSWLLFIATIGWAVVTLMGVTTALDVVDQVENGEKDPPPARMPSAWDPDVKTPAQWMIICFGAALLATAAAGFFRPAPAAVPPPPASGAPAASSSPAASGAAAAARPTARIDYGVLGDPRADPTAWQEADPDFDFQSARAKLVLFRQNERHPLQGTVSHSFDWTQIEEHEALQRALYYAVLQAAPALITPQDRRWVAADEQGLIYFACANRGVTGVLYAVPQKDCPAAQR